MFKKNIGCHIGKADLHFLQFGNGHSAVTIQSMTLVCQQEVVVSSTPTIKMCRSRLACGAGA